MSAELDKLFEEMPETMDIYTKKGKKVKPIFKDGELCNGYEHHKEHASKYLKEGEVYTVNEVYVEDWSSTVELEEFEGVEFNTVHFVNID